MSWIKTETTLFEKPEVLRMASILYPQAEGSDGCDIVAAKLQRLWIWADSNSIDGTCLMVDVATIDKIVGKPGFSDAMRVVGWLIGEDWSLSLPNFSRHNGASTKRRAESAKRQSAFRSRNSNTKSVTKVTRDLKNSNTESNASCVTEVTRSALPREDKIREDKKEEVPPMSPKGELDGKESSNNGRYAEEIAAKRKFSDRICSIMHRRLGTKWSDKERRALNKIFPAPEEDIAAVEAYYAATIAQKDDIRRRDVGTLLNNWPGEVDRAKRFVERYGNRNHGGAGDGWGA